MATRMSDTDLATDERFARIRQMSADADARYAEAVRATKEASLALPRLLITAIGATAAITAAVTALLTTALI